METVESRYTSKHDAWKSLIDEAKGRVTTAPMAASSASSWALAYGVIGVLAAILILAQGGESPSGRFLLYLACAYLAAFDLRLTYGQSVLPAGLLFLLLGIEDLGLPEVLFMALSITLVREIRSVRRQSDFIRLLYSIASVAIGIAAAESAFRAASQLTSNILFPAPILASAFVLTLNCGLATTLLTMPTEASLGACYRECRRLLPWFIATAYVAYLIQCTGLRAGYHPALIALPVLLILDHGYRTWSGAMAGLKDEFVQLHRNTLETLALAIDARDQTTHMHLRRVQICALAVGRELKLSAAELEALNIAALLHDIGKLAIPDHILLKPGALTPEEWEKMKTHAVIGAEMLSRMRFPDLVSSIVKTHHEKWDGTGYPDGLSGTNIPIGARILSAVDCLDALASDRPYRTAFTLEDAMAVVRGEAGKSYDPNIISILERKYVELDHMARGTVGSTPASPDHSRAATQQGIANLTTRLLAESKVATKNDILSPIVSARQETQSLQALASDLAHSARLDEVVPVIHKCLGEMITYHTLAVYIRHEENLEPVYIVGDHVSLFTKTAFPITQGLSGWVAQHARPILNGNVSLECCYANDSIVLNNLQTALAVPFESRGGTRGVITLYHLDRNAFTRDDLRVLEAATVQIGPAIEGALKFQNAEESAVTDHLTGIPNARALALHLERELGRASREQSTIGVLVCDLDGFKQVNDRFGHLIGNEVLQRVATGLREACRGSDYLARMGGDEFVIVLPGLQGDYTSHLERLRLVAAAAGEAVCGERCLSMSVGVAIYPFDGSEAEALIAQADRRMYQLKHQSKSARDQNGALVD